MKKITGGYRGFRAAVLEGHYSAHCCNPTVFYNSDNGFYVQPDTHLIPNNDYRVGACNFNANTGKFYEISLSAYDLVRAEILALVA